MYVIVSGRAYFRDESGVQEASAGDVLMYPPDEAHQISNPGPDDLIYYIIADNPPGDSCHYPDSGKWNVHTPPKGRIVIKGEPANYFDGEE
jgi:uncharacterized cupin superfamily protein